MEVNSHNNTFYSAPGSEMSKYRAMAHTETNHHDIFHSHTHQMTSKETIKLSSPLKMSISNNSIHSIKGNSSSNASMPSLEKNIWIMTPLSKCTERPCFLATNHFFAQEKIYSELKMKIEQVLKGMQDYDVSYFDTECMVSNPLKYVLNLVYNLHPDHRYLLYE